jgi:SnoaL-like protein
MFECDQPDRVLHKRRRKNEMNEQGVPNLEEMDEQQTSHFLTELLPKLSPEEEYEIRHEDYVMEMPQSGERIRGRQKMRAFQEAYPNPPAMRLRRIIVEGHLWIMEGVSDYGGEIYHQIAIVELRDGKIWRETRYYAEPFEAPEWRAQWVERMEEG